MEKNMITNTGTDIVTEHNNSILHISMEDAETFLEMRMNSAAKIANATLMCIISPVLLVILSTMADDHILGVTETFACGVGLIFLFIMIAAAVFTFIMHGMKKSHPGNLEKDNFETEYGVFSMVQEKRRNYEMIYTKGIAVGTVLCILSVLPLIIGGIMDAPDYLCGLFTAILLCIVAVGVNLIIRVRIVNNSYNILLQEGEFSKAEKNVKKKLDAFSGVYWCLATTIYLGWSFWRIKWYITWMVWPVAGVLYAAVYGIMRIALGMNE